MTDQLIIGDRASFDDYEASLARRNIGMPTKKSIKETVPFSNVTYDFSKIDGELYWEERELEYTFEIIASTPERLEELKAAFASWVMNVHEEEIRDPFIPDYHFVGTFDDIDFEDEESLDKTTVTVKFMAYPYKIANLPTVVEGYTDAQDAYFSVVNNSSHRVVAVLKTDRTMSVTLTFEQGEYSGTMFTSNERETNFYLPCGYSYFCIMGNDRSEYSFSVSFREEVF